jgi:hypothetical protein
VEFGVAEMINGCLNSVELSIPVEKWAIVPIEKWTTY